MTDKRIEPDGLEAKQRNGASDRFDKLMRRDALMKADDDAIRKADDALRVLRKLAPAVARTVEEVDAKFAALIDKLTKIEATHEAQARARPTLQPGREPNGDEVLAAMRGMTAEARAALLNKLKQ